MTTRARLDHLLAAARHDHRRLVAAVLRCCWLYADLGRRLHDRATVDHRFRERLLTYSDPAFAAAIKIATRHAAKADQKARTAMRCAFRVTAEHELAFRAAPLQNTGSDQTDQNSTPGGPACP